MTHQPSRSMASLRVPEIDLSAVFARARQEPSEIENQEANDQQAICSGRPFRIRLPPLVALFTIFTVPSASAVANWVPSGLAAPASAQCSWAALNVFWSWLAATFYRSVALDPCMTCGDSTTSRSGLNASDPAPHRDGEAPQ